MRHRDRPPAKVVPSSASIRRRDVIGVGFRAPVIDVVDQGINGRHLLARRDGDEEEEEEENGGGGGGLGSKNLHGQ